MAAEAELASVPSLPPLFAHLWAGWVDLCATRPTGGFGLSPLSRLEIQAWEADEGHALEPWERRAVLQLDATYRRINQSDEP